MLRKKYGHVLDLHSSIWWGITIRSRREKKVSRRRIYT